jgi:hypothetical protein
MEKKSQPKTLNELLDRIDEAEEEKAGEVPLDSVMDAVGRRSFGPQLLLAGVVIAAPGVGDIPGVPTIIGLFILLVSGQLLFGRERFWMPQWLLRRAVSKEKLKKMTGSKWVRRPAKWVDAVVKERLTMFIGSWPIALASSVIALASPLTEFVPMGSVGLGIAILAFGVALIARDGVMALTGYVLAALTLGLAIIAAL